MQSVASTFVVASAAIILLLGLVHLAFTFRGSKLLPRDRDLQARMTAVSPVITRETTMWKAWVGFNASHAWGLVLFGAVYGDLALEHAPVLFGSTFLLAVGMLLLSGWFFLAWKYFFRVPFRAVVVATTLYGLALVVNAMP